jgi:hypothetical protein
MRRHSVENHDASTHGGGGGRGNRRGFVRQRYSRTCGPARVRGFALPGVVNINISDGTSMTFNGGGTSINAPTEIGGTPGAVQGTVDPSTGRMDFHFIHGANDDRHFAGNAFPADVHKAGSVARPRRDG